ncbi:MAG: type III pantothenate kinase, partial [Alicyclobacillus sp.]|nr:type III pantothenate kinase [Alicyclobacillus sp.]
ELARPRQVIGRNTVASMQSGVYHGFAGLVDGMVTRIREELDLPYRVVATGGWADLVAPGTRVIDVIDPYLTLDGLNLLWQRNRPE